MSNPIDTVCRYRVKRGHEEEFERLLMTHWQVLSNCGFTTADPARIQRASDGAGNRAYLESFSWASRDAVEAAHESVEVMRHWEPMGALCEDMEFWNVEAL